jgi:DNA-binding NarL/FixJ family response regulator
MMADVVDDVVENVARSRVLVVEDHDLVAESLRRALSEEPDLEVVGIVDSVRSSVRAAVELRPDIVVMDYRLPDGTGSQATALIKAQLPDAEVVMLTGQGTGATLAEALEAGCSGFVTKDGPFVDLVLTLRAVVAGEVRVPQHLVAELANQLRPRNPKLGSDLSARELEVLTLLAAGKSTAEMVELLHLSIHTVRNHIRNILAKLQSRSRLEAVAVATRLNLVPRP